MACAIFQMDGYCLWDPSLVKDESGKHHLFFSRWPVSKGFQAWVTDSEVCRATAETPFGPYHFAEVVLPKRPGYWDGDVTHNPRVHRFNGQYYLYYTGNRGNGEWWDHRTNQRVGVAIAKNPEGPWRRSEHPLIDITPGGWDAMVTTNPSCAETPDGKYILIYKGVGGALAAPQYGPVLHGIAFSDHPDGPFIKHTEPVLSSNDAAFPGEDPFLWHQNGRYHILLKDMDRNYSPTLRAIVHFESVDGIDWTLSQNPVFQERVLYKADGKQEEVHRLERPFLYFQPDGSATFYSAVKRHQDQEASIIAAMLVKGGL